MLSMQRLEFSFSHLTLTRCVELFFTSDPALSCYTGGLLMIEKSPMFKSNTSVGIYFEHYTLFYSMSNKSFCRMENVEGKNYLFLWMLEDRSVSHNRILMCHSVSILSNCDVFDISWTTSNTGALTIPTEEGSGVSLDLLMGGKSIQLQWVNAAVPFL